MKLKPSQLHAQCEKCCVAWKSNANVFCDIPIMYGETSHAYCSVTVKVQVCRTWTCYKFVHSNWWSRRSYDSTVSNNEHLSQHSETMFHQSHLTYTLAVKFTSSNHVVWNKIWVIIVTKVQHYTTCVKSCLTLSLFVKLRLTSSHKTKDRKLRILTDDIQPS